MSKALEIFRKNANARLKELKWKYPELGRRTKIAPSTLSVYFTGKKKPSIDVIERIAEGLGISIIEILNDHMPAKAIPMEPTPEQALEVLAKAIRNKKEQDPDREKLHKLLDQVPEHALPAVELWLMGHQSDSESEQQSS